MKPDNAAELMSQPDVDGALVGGASLKAKRLPRHRERCTPLITLVTVIHVVVCVFLILVILLQAGKGGGMGGAFGGAGAQTVFGGRGAQTLPRQGDQRLPPASSCSRR